MGLWCLWGRQLRSLACADWLSPQWREVTWQSAQLAIWSPTATSTKRSPTSSGQWGKSEATTRTHTHEKITQNRLTYARRASITCTSRLEIQTKRGQKSQFTSAQKKKKHTQSFPWLEERKLFIYWAVEPKDTRIYTNTFLPKALSSKLKPSTCRLFTRGKKKKTL